MNSVKIRSECRRRGISNLYHFTPIANLSSILVNGLVSRSILDANQVIYTYTDDLRLDGQLDAVSFSIHSINQSMFSRKLSELDCPFVVLEVDASVLWTHACRFCWTNAASSAITKHSGYIGGPWAFNQMFADCPVSARDSRSARQYHNTPKNLPTRNDAEVQVLEPIEPDLIRDITVADENVRIATEASMKEVGRVLPIAVVPEVFV